MSVIWTMYPTFVVSPFNHPPPSRLQEVTKPHDHSAGQAPDPPPRPPFATVERMTFSLFFRTKVDPVTIESLDKFGTPDEVGARVIRVEQGKDGTLDTKLFGATAEKQGDLSLYTLVRGPSFASCFWRSLPRGMCV